MKLLVTRPEPDATRTAQALAARGHEAVVAPVAVIRPLAVLLPEKAFQAVLLTSANAARAVTGDPSLAAMTGLPALCVGARTAAAARDAGFANARPADGNAKALAGLIVTELDPTAGPLLHLSGREIAANLAELLAADGFEVVRRVVYDTIAAKVLPEPARAALEDRAIDAALLYSPRSARTLGELARAAGLSDALDRTPCACMSRAVADAAREGGFRRVAIAERLEEDALFAAAETLAGAA